MQEKQPTAGADSSNLQGTQQQQQQQQHAATNAAANGSIESSDSALTQHRHVAAMCESSNSSNSNSSTKAVASSSEAAAAPGSALSLSDPPAGFVCPITNELLKDPVRACDGLAYEREAIEVRVVWQHAFGLIHV
jgi:hypothetical protein